MTREGRDFKVIDAKSEEDITHNVLTQIIMEEENRGQTMLPVSFLRQLISLYGDSMQSMVPQYLEASMESFRRNQLQFRTAMEGAFTGGPFAGGPFAEMAKRNLEMFEVAAKAFKASTEKEAADSSTTPSQPQTHHAGADEVADLKSQLASLQSKIDKLG